MNRAVTAQAQGDRVDDLGNAAIGVPNLMMGIPAFAKITPAFRTPPTLGDIQMPLLSRQKQPRHDKLFKNGHTALHTRC